MITRVALVTGANRGIGLEICRQLAALGMNVILSARDRAQGEVAARSLASAGRAVEFRQLDVTREPSVAETAAWVRERHGRLDVLVNNAGIFRKRADDPELDDERIRESFETNTLGPYRMCRAFAPLMLEKGYGRIVNISSGMGQLSEMEGGYPAYRISKTALNAVTRIFAEELGGQDILVNSVCPGWVKTDMGGAEAELPVERGADTPVWLATLPKGGPTGGFFRERERIEW